MVPHSTDICVKRLGNGRFLDQELMEALFRVVQDQTGSHGAADKNIQHFCQMKALFLYDPHITARPFHICQHPIQDPDDLKGLKIRVPGGDFFSAFYTAFGASPQAMSWSEVFTALQQGTIDAQENPLSVITSSRFNEVQDYLSMTEHVYSAAPLMVSKAAYDALPDDLKAIVDEAGVEACQWEREYLAEVEVQWLDELETAGTQINYPDKAPFVDAMSSVYNQFVGDGDDMVSPELLEQVREIISQVE